MFRTHDYWAADSRVCAVRQRLLVLLNDQRAARMARQRCGSDSEHALVVKAGGARLPQCMPVLLSERVSGWN